MAWFRGAADLVSLDPDCKSMVVYGTNGSGKSSFVDAVEYVINDGKISHLAHEYSGKRQEKAVLNTHRPAERKTELRIKLNDASEVKADISQDGTAMILGTAAVAMRTWDYRRTVLRQDEVAEFIHDTKGGKYSALLPLLGLHQLEVAAENLRQLAKSVEEESKLRETKVTLTQVETKRKAAFGTDSDRQILAKIIELHSKYCPYIATTTDVLSRCTEVKTALDTLIAGSSADQRRYVALQGAAELDLAGHVSAVRSASVKLAGAVEPLISEKLAVLQSSVMYVEKLLDKTEVKCPACGRPVSVEAFQTHVDAERARLQEIIKVFDIRKAAIGSSANAARSAGDSERAKSTPDPSPVPVLLYFYWLNSYWNSAATRYDLY